MDDEKTMRLVQNTWKSEPIEAKASRDMENTREDVKVQYSDCRISMKYKCLSIKLENYSKYVAYGT